MTFIQGWFLFGLVYWFIKGEDPFLIDQFIDPEPDQDHEGRYGAYW
ncbi:hypothetical protein HZC00_05635 [Candidatus Kaiserbacteria bacterium]|nr:hypothetical protein [Candidatus Kaiserbacteria bacterium]